MASKIALVTGGNKGVGFEIVKQLLEQGSFHVILTARDEAKGREALTKLNNNSKVSYVPLNVDDKASAHACAELVRQKFPEIDVLINNAGILLRQNSGTSLIERAKATIHTNYTGSLYVTQAFLPLLKPHSRIINVSSQLGQLHHIPSSDLRNTFASPDLTIEKLSELMNEYIRDVENNLEGFDRKWPSTSSEYSPYIVSKVGLIAMTKIFARELKSRNIGVHSCTPGYCRTDMTGGLGNQSASDGAQTMAWLATADLPESGLFYMDKAPLDW